VTGVDQLSTSGLLRWGTTLTTLPGLVRGRHLLPNSHGPSGDQLMQIVALGRLGSWMAKLEKIWTAGQ